MLQDLMLTEYGDIVLVDEKREGCKVELFFYITDSNAIAIDFDFYEQTKKKNSLPFCLTFSFESEESSIKEKMISGKAFLEQQISSVLKTALTERIYDETYGSALEKHLHKNIRDKSYLIQVANIAKEAIDELQLLSDYTITATYNKAKSLTAHSFIITFHIAMNATVLDIDWKV